MPMYNLNGNEAFADSIIAFCGFISIRSGSAIVAGTLDESESFLSSRTYLDQESL